MSRAHGAPAPASSSRGRGPHLPPASGSCRSCAPRVPKAFGRLMLCIPKPFVTPSGVSEVSLGKLGFVPEKQAMNLGRTSSSPEGRHRERRFFPTTAPPPSLAGGTGAGAPGRLGTRARLRAARGRADDRGSSRVAWRPWPGGVPEASSTPPVSRPTSGASAWPCWALSLVPKLLVLSAKSPSLVGDAGPQHAGLQPQPRQGRSGELRSRSTWTTRRGSLCQGLR